MDAKTTERLRQLLEWLDYEGATSLADKLTAVRAALLDQITALRMAELDAANLPADVDAVKAVTDLLPDGGALTTLTAYVDGLETAIGAIEGATTLHNKLTAARAALLDEITALRMAELDAANIPADIDELKASKGRQLFSMDFWSNPQEEVSIPAMAGTLTLPSVTVADLPAGATIVRAIAMLKFRMVENTNVAANKLNGATVPATSQVIQVRDDTPGTWRDAVNFVDDQFGLAASTREGGDVLIGSVDIAVEVDGNDTYEFQYLLALADVASLNLNDCQTGLRIWYSV